MTELVEMIAKAYISVYGVEKWNSLTEQEQHDAIIAVANDTLNAVNEIA